MFENVAIIFGFYLDCFAKRIFLCTCTFFFAKVKSTIDSELLSVAVIAN